MKLYLDDNMTDQRVVTQLQRAGHAVSVPTDVGHDGAPDAQHLLYAIRSASVLLTQDVKDFTDLHDLI